MMDLLNSRVLQFTSGLASTPADIAMSIYIYCVDINCVRVRFTVSNRGKNLRAAAAAANLRAAEPRICGPRFFNKQIFKKNLNLPRTEGFPKKKN